MQHICTTNSNKPTNSSNKAANKQVDVHDSKFYNDKHMFIVDSILTKTPIKSKITKIPKNRNNLNGKSLSIR